MGCAVGKVLVPKIEGLRPLSRISEQDEQGDEDEKRALKSSFLSNRFHHGCAVTCMDISEDLSMLVTGTSNGTILVWSTMSNPAELLVDLVGHKGSVTCIQFEGNSIISGSELGVLIKWSIHEMIAEFVYLGHKGKINHIHCSGGFIFSTGYDRTARAWHMEPKTDPQSQDDLHICTFIGHQNSVFPVAYIPTEENQGIRPHNTIYDRDVVVTGSADCTARIWSLSTAECLKVLTGHTAPVHSIMVDMETNSIFTGGGDGLIIAHCPITGDRLRTLYGHEGAILQLTIFKGFLLSCSTDRTARCWVMEFGEETRCFKGHQSPVTYVHYFEGLVFTAEEDGICRAFDAKSGSLKRTFKFHSEIVNGLRATDRRLFSVSTDGNLCVWDTTGMEDETVMGMDGPEEEEEESDPDGEEIREAISVLDKHLDRRG